MVAKAGHTAHRLKRELTRSNLENIVYIVNME